MSSLVIDQVAQQETLLSIFGAVKKADIEQMSDKKAYERKVNDFLDGINARKRFLTERTAATEQIAVQAQAVTWFSNLSPENTQAIRDLIEIMASLHKKIIENYVIFSRYFEKHKLAKTELKALKEAADNLLEVTRDIESRFFTLPRDVEFQAMMAEFATLPPLSVG